MKMKSLSLLENVAKIPLFCKIMVDLLEGECEALLLSSFPPSLIQNKLAPGETLPKGPSFH